MPHKQARRHCGTPCVQHRVRRCFKVKHMRSIQATGKSVDAAIFSGLQQLGLSIDEVTINVIQHGTKGLLGIGAKPAIVELTEKPAEEVVVPDFTAQLWTRTRASARRAATRRSELHKTPEPRYCGSGFFSFGKQAGHFSLNRMSSP